MAFARVRDVLGWAQQTIELDADPTVAGLWDVLIARVPALAALRASTRTARNGVVVTAQTPLGAGDEVALLPPVSGG